LRVWDLPGASLVPPRHDASDSFRPMIRTMQLALAVLVGAVALASVPVAGARSLGAWLKLNPIQVGGNAAKSLLLDARQAPSTPNIPQECQDACNTVVATINVRSIRLMRRSSSLILTDVHSLYRLAHPANVARPHMNNNCSTASLA
jgi:hypothetical protein